MRSKGSLSFVIPADCFYEWQSTSTGKQPFRFTLKGGGLFCMASLWEKWIRPARTGELDLGDDTAAGETIETFTVITTEPNAMVAKVHDRMPVILGPEHYQWWLEPNRFDRQFQKSLFPPYPAEAMTCVRVSKLVINARHDSPACLQPGSGLPKGFSRGPGRPALHGSSRAR